MVAVDLQCGNDLDLGREKSDLSVISDAASMKGITSAVTILRILLR